MKPIKFISRIKKIIEIACQECCLEAHTTHTSVAKYCVIQAEIPLTNKKLLMESKIKNRQWNKNVDIWINYPSGIVGLHQCHITKLIDAIMQIKKAP